MKKMRSRHEGSAAAGRVLSPAPVIVTSAWVLLCMIYICAIILLLLPESFCDPGRAMQCARDIFSVSFRIVALTAISAVCADMIDVRFPDGR